MQKTHSCDGIWVVGQDSGMCKKICQEWSEHLKLPANRTPEASLGKKSTHLNTLGETFLILSVEYTFVSTFVLVLLVVLTSFRSKNNRWVTGWWTSGRRSRQGNILRHMETYGNMTFEGNLQDDMNLWYKSNHVCFWFNIEDISWILMISNNIYDTTICI